MVNILKSFFSQCARPKGALGRVMLSFMNYTHAPLTNWGLKLVDVQDGWTMLDVGCGGGFTIRRLLKAASKRGQSPLGIPKGDPCYWKDARRFSSTAPKGKVNLPIKIHIVGNGGMSMAKKRLIRTDDILQLVTQTINTPSADGDKEVNTSSIAFLSIVFVQR